MAEAIDKSDIKKLVEAGAHQTQILASAIQRLTAIQEESGSTASIVKHSLPEVLTDAKYGKLASTQQKEADKDRDKDQKVQGHHGHLLEAMQKSLSMQNQHNKKTDKDQAVSDSLLTEKNTKEGGKEKKRFKVWTDIKNSVKGMRKSMTSKMKFGLKAALIAIGLTALIAFLESDMWKNIVESLKTWDGAGFTSAVDGIVAGFNWMVSVICGASDVFGKVMDGDIVAASKSLWENFGIFGSVIVGLAAIWVGVKAFAALKALKAIGSASTSLFRGFGVMSSASQKVAKANVKHIQKMGPGYSSQATKASGAQAGSQYKMGGKTYAVGKDMKFREVKAGKTGLASRGPALKGGSKTLTKLQTKIAGGMKPTLTGKWGPGGGVGKPLRVGPLSQNIARTPIHQRNTIGKKLIQNSPRVAKWLRMVPGLSAMMSAWDIWTILNDEQMNNRQKAAGVMGSLGGLAGATLGGMLGGMLGLSGGPLALLTGAGGAMLGWYAGGEIAKTMAEVMLGEPISTGWIADLTSGVGMEHTPTQLKQSQDKIKARAKMSQMFFGGKKFDPSKGSYKDFVSANLNPNISMGSRLSDEQVDVLQAAGIDAEGWFGANKTVRQVFSKGGSHAKFAQTQMSTLTKLHENQTRLWELLKKEREGDILPSSDMPPMINNVSTVKNEIGHMNKTFGVRSDVGWAGNYY